LAIVERMQAERVRVVLATAYYDPRHALFVAEKTGAKVVSLAHAVGARAGTDDYLRMIDYNVRQLVAALGAGG
jgi:ABC-type Zn uptake system ZnuABC Zn-binding protein ZnuA